MKLKNYLSAKRLRRKLSKHNVNESHCNVNSSFTDFNDNEVGPAVITKDDMYLRPKKDGGIGVRSDMTQSFSGCLPSYESRLVQTDYFQTRDFGSQTDLELAAQNSCQTYSPISADPNLFFYKDSIDNVEISTTDTEGQEDSCSCRIETNDSCASCTWHYHSLPSTQTSHQYIQDIHYNSLPSAMTQSVQPASQSSTESTHQCDKWRRSRIKTNPWLPLPKTTHNETIRRTRKVSSRAEPRLSRFFSEVYMCE